MIPSRTMNSTAASDAELVQDSLAGNRDAFGRIVKRYQSLVCSLAYSTTGDLGHSEDLAQETFVAAWKQLRSLREPEKLKSWLCGIVRNLALGARRKDGREPSHRAEEWGAAGEPAAAEPAPVDQAISREEASLLWRALERIPEVYREPLVLFYRQNRSIERVAAELDLSEDAVKQRLSRGRRLLQEQVLAMVEGALGRTTPGPAFTMSVLGALPLAATGAGLGTLGGASAKGAGWLATSGWLLGPGAGILSAFLGYKIGMAQAESEAERRFIRRFTARLWIFLIVGISAPMALSYWGGPLFGRHPGALPWVIAGLAIGFAGALAALLRWCRRTAPRAIAAAGGPAESKGVLAPISFEYRSRASLLGLPLVHVLFARNVAGRRRPVRAWIAAGDRAFGVIAAFGAVAVAPLAIGAVAVGLIGWGACGFGVVAFGGLAVGVWAIGGIVIGWSAMGALALGWHTALGGWAAACDYADGRSVASASRAVGPEAWALRREAYRVAQFGLTALRWLSLLWIGLGFIFWRVLVRIRRRKQA
jgi:RNA polymerase sigma factor (sigma-70 family)